MANNKEYQNSYMKERYRLRREEAIKRLGGKCSKCSSRDELEFHHINPEEKSFTIAKGSSFSEERWQDEISKCVLLCRTCHLASHKANNPHGSVKRYWRGCRCEQCKAANAKHGREYKQRRKEHLGSNT